MATTEHLYAVQWKAGRWWSSVKDQIEGRLIPAVYESRDEAEPRCAEMQQAWPEEHYRTAVFSLPSSDELQRQRGPNNHE